MAGRWPAAVIALGPTAPTIPLNACPAACSPSDVLAGGPGGKRAGRVRVGVVLNAFKPLLGEMTDNPNALKTSPGQYRERAKTIRRQAETMGNVEIRNLLLGIAEQFEQLADGIERPRRGC
jgi:hypothetical protein